MVEVYARQLPNGQLLFSDDGQTIRELEMVGFERLSNKRQRAIDEVMLNYGIRMEQDELVVKTSVAQAKNTLHRFIQAILDLLNLHYLAKVNIQNFFLDDVTELLTVQRLPFIRDASFYGQSGLSHKCDFIIPALGNRKETILQAIQTPRRDLVENTLFKITDILRQRPQLAGMVVLNDEKDFNRQLLDAFDAYDIPGLPMSNPQEIVRRLQNAA